MFNVICYPPYLDIKRTDYGSFIKHQNNIDWTIMYNSNEVDVATNNFYNIVHEGIHLFVPKKYQ